METYIVGMYFLDLPNGKYIYYNNNTYQSNLQRLLTQSDYSTLNSLISNINSNKTQIQYYTASTTNSDSNTISVSDTFSSARIIIVTANAYILEWDNYERCGATCVLSGNTSCTFYNDQDNPLTFRKQGNSITVTYSAQYANDSGRIDIYYATFT